MAETITATYVQDAEDWSITVAGLGKELTARAPGIIAARDRADQLVENLASDGKGTTVVHLLNGSALEFTTAYMTARLTRPAAETAETEVTESETAEVTEATEATDTEESAGEDEAQETGEVPEQSRPAAGKPAVPTKELSKEPKAAQETGNATEQEQGKAARATSR